MLLLLLLLRLLIDRKAKPFNLINSLVCVRRDCSFVRVCIECTFALNALS